MAKLKMPKPKTNKVVGYVLLLVGLILILLAIYWAINALTSGSSPISVFKWENQNVSIPQGDNHPPQSLSIPGESISKSVNLLLWLVLMIFVAIGGGIIAILGVRMTQDIKVEVKVKK